VLLDISEIDYKMPFQMSFKIRRWKWVSVQVAEYRETKTHTQVDRQQE